MTDDRDEISQDLQALGSVPPLSDAHQARLRAELLASLAESGTPTELFEFGEGDVSRRSSSWLLAVAASVVLLVAIASIALFAGRGERAVDAVVISETKATPSVATPTAEAMTEAPLLASCVEPARLDLANPVAPDLGRDGQTEFIIVAVGTHDEGAGRVVDYSVMSTSVAADEDPECAWTEMAALRSGPWRDFNGDTGSYEWLCAYRSRDGVSQTRELVQLVTFDAASKTEITVFDLVEPDGHGYPMRARPPTVVYGELPDTAVRVKGRTGPESCEDADGPYSYTSVEATSCAHQEWDIELPERWHTMVVGGWACQTLSPWPMQLPCDCDAGNHVAISSIGESQEDAVVSVLGDSFVEPPPEDTFPPFLFGETLGAQDHVRTYLRSRWGDLTVAFTMNYSTTWDQGTSDREPMSYAEMIDATEDVVRSAGILLSYPAENFDPSPPPAVGEPRCVTEPADGQAAIHRSPHVDSEVLDLVVEGSCALRAFGEPVDGWVLVRALREDSNTATAVSVDGWVMASSIRTAEQSDSPEAALVAEGIILALRDRAQDGDAPCASTGPDTASCSYGQWGWSRAYDGCGNGTFGWERSEIWVADLKRVDGRWIVGERAPVFAPQC